MKKLTITKSNLILCLILFFETCIIKIIQYTILPDKYFYDSRKILAIMNGSALTDKGYSFTANFFKKINIFGFYDIKQWSIAISIVFLIFFIVFFSKRRFNFIEFVYIIIAYALLNIYVFNLSKDIIQLFFFIIVYFICSNQKYSNKKKIIIVSGIFIIESLFFRTYYFIIGILTIGLYYIYCIFFENEKIQNKKRTGFIVIISFILFMFMIFILQKISSENYMLIINARSSSNIYRDSTDAVTMINDIFKNTNYFFFVINYIINTVRIMFPIELIVKGIKYLPFIILQIFFSGVLLKNLIHVKKEKSIYIFAVMAFTMVSIIYEPDFGSVIRHESVLIMFVLELLNNREDEKNGKSISYNTNI